MTNFSSTHKVVNNLTGDDMFTRPQAEGVVDTIITLTDHLATKEDLKQTKRELRTEITEVRTEVVILRKDMDNNTSKIISKMYMAMIAMGLML